MNRHPSLYGLGGGWAQGIVRGGVALAFAGKSDCVFGDEALAGVVQSVAGEGYVAAIRSGHADGTVEKLAAGDVDALALIQLQQSGEAGLTFGGFIKDTATGEGDVRTAGETHAGAVTRRMSAKGVAADVDKARIFDEQVAVFAGINRVAADSDTVATGKMHVVFLTADDVTADGE